MSAWQDQSGNDNDAIQNTATNQPTYVTNVINGFPAMRFDGTNDYFVLPDFMSGNTTGGEAFVVLKVGPTWSWGGQNALWYMGASIYSPWVAYPGMTGGVSEDFGSTTFQLLGLPAQPLNQYHVYEVSSQTGNWAAWNNGILLYQTNRNQVGFNSGTSPYYWSTSPYLGRGVPGWDGDFNPYSYYFSGDIAEVMVFDRALSSDERWAVGNYLNQRYNLVTTAPVIPPSYLRADAVSSSQVVLTWSSATNTSEYLIERKTGIGGVYSQIATVQDVTELLDSGLAPQTQYFYRIRSSNYAGTSAYSSEVSVTTPPAECDVPLSQLILWLKADAQNWTNGTAVALWPDLSGGQNNATQPTIGSQPSVVTNALNGRPAVQFDGTNDTLNFQDCLTGTTQGEVFVVLKADSVMPATNMGALCLGPDGDEYPATNGVINEDFGTMAPRTLASGLQPLSWYNVYNIQANSNSWMAELNGTTLLASTNDEFEVTSHPALGNPAYPFAGEMAEVMIFSRTLTSGERASVVNYLNQRYAIVTTPPPAPVLTISTNSDGSVTLGWAGVTNAIGYLVERAVGTNSAFNAIATLPYGTETNYTDLNLSAGLPYVYRIQAMNWVGISVPSSQVLRPLSSQGDVVVDYLEDYLLGIDPTMGSGANNTLINLEIYTPLK